MSELQNYQKHIRLQNHSFPDNQIAYLIEGLVNHFNGHREIFIEGVMWLQGMSARFKHDFTITYEPNIKTGDGRESCVELQCQYDPNELSDQGGVWDIWIEWNYSEVDSCIDSCIDAYKIPLNIFKDETFRFSIKNLWRYWMP